MELQRPKYTVHQLKPQKRINPAPISPVPPLRELKNLKTMSHQELVEELKILSDEIDRLTTAIDRGSVSSDQREQLVNRRSKLIGRHKTVLALVNTRDFESFANCFIRAAWEYLPIEVYESIERCAKRISKY